MLSRRELLDRTGSLIPALSGFQLIRPKNNRLRYRWVYIAANLQSQSEVARVISILERAAACGFNGVVLAEWKILVLNTATPQYVPNLQKVLACAKSLSLSLIPTVCPMGASESILQRDPNLAEGVPCRKVKFCVDGHIATSAGQGQQLLTNGNLEEASNNKFVGWSYQDAPGQCTFQDGGQLFRGLPSLRVGINSGSPLRGTNGRLYQKVMVPPYHQFRFTVWIRAAKFKALSMAGLTVLGDNGEPLAFPQWQLEPSQDWHRYQITFNSLGSKFITVILGVWGLDRGDIWFNSPKLEEVGLLNLLRRHGTPLEVTTSSGEALREGVDYEPVSDPQMGMVPYSGSYDVSHQPPSIILKSNTFTGKSLFVSYWHAVPIYWGEVPACLNNAEVFAIMHQQVKDVVAHIHPDAIFLSHDEIRVANWCNDCLALHGTPGALLAHNVNKCQALVRSIAPQAIQCIWSDMFDPYHNARAHYFLVNGTLAGSWNGLCKDTVIVNWNYDHRHKSMPWFSAKGFRQVLAGYYDGAADSIAGWLNDAANVDGIEGVMYTTWQNQYNDLEAFAHYAWKQ